MLQGLGLAEAIGFEHFVEASAHVDGGLSAGHEFQGAPEGAELFDFGLASRALFQMADKFFACRAFEISGKVFGHLFFDSFANHDALSPRRAKNRSPSSRSAR